MAQTPAKNYSDEGAVDHTPSVAVTAGDVVVIGCLVCVADLDIPANAKGAVRSNGVFKIPKATGAVTKGDPAYWNPAGNPNTGTAGSGAIQNTGGAAVFFAGTILADAASGDDYAVVQLSGHGGTQRAAITGGKSEATVSITSTLTAAQTVGGFVNSAPAGAITLTLPTAALLVAAVPGAKVGDEILLTIENTSGGANAITLAAGAGGTLRGGTSVAQNKAALVRIVLTNVTAASEAYTAHSIIGA